MPSVQIDGLTVEYDEVGLGLPMVLLPGLVGSRKWFKYQFSGLGDRYRVISFDLREPHRKPEYTMDLLVEDVARFLAAVRLPSVVLGGHSFGGLIAQKFALTYPQSVGALMLFSTFARLPDLRPSRIAEILAPITPPVESPIHRLLGVFGGRKETDDTEQDGLEWLAAHSQTLTRAALNTRLRLAANFDTLERLGDIGIPTLVTVGAREDPVLLDTAQTLEQNIPDASLEVIEDGDHFSFFTRHDLFNAAVDEFLSARMATLS